MIFLTLPYGKINPVPPSSSLLVDEVRDLGLEEEGVELKLNLDFGVDDLEVDFEDDLDFDDDLDLELGLDLGFA